MRKIFLFLAASLILLPSYAQEPNWNISKSNHFIIYYKNAPEDAINRVITNVEDYYNEIANNLGFTRFNFWLWDNRANIYIYDNADDYRVSTKQPAWSVGAARPREKLIYTYPYAQGFFETVLPHEMGHIIFREFVGSDNPAVPTWLDEGVASYQQSLQYSMALPLARKAAANGTLHSLEKLTAINPQSITDTASAQLYYAEAISIVDYLIKEFGKDSFVLFCQDLRDKRDLQRAICSVYPFSNLQEFDQAWQKYLKK